MASLRYAVEPDENTPIQCLEAEQATLGSMLLDADMASKVLPTLKGRDFFSDAHGRLFEAIGIVEETGAKADFVTVGAHLRVNGLFDTVGGLPYITTLMDSVPTPANALWYARIVLNYSLRRQAGELAEALAVAAAKGGAAFAQVLTTAQDRLFEIQVSLEPGEVRPTFGTVATDFVTEALGRFEDVEFQGVPTGFSGLNRKTSGFRHSELWLVVARPSVGKTAFAMSVTQAIAKKCRVLFLSLEMTSGQLAPRLYSLLSGVPAWVLEHKSLTGEQQDRLVRAREDFERLRIIVDDPSSMTLSELRQRVKQAETEEVDLVIVDHAGYLTVPNARDATHAMTAITKGVKKIAKDFSIPIMLLAQLNRENVKREDKRPRMEDIRDSGAAEADADVIIGIHRDGYYDVETNTEEEPAELIVLKSRNGTRGVVKATYIPGMTLFCEADDEPYGRDGYAR